LTAKVQTYTKASVQAELRDLFDKQYTLTVREEVQVRYRTERRTGSYTDSEGNSHSYSYTVQVPYDYYILKPFPIKINMPMGQIYLRMYKTPVKSLLIKKRLQCPCFSNFTGMQQSLNGHLSGETGNISLFFNENSSV